MQKSNISRRKEMFLMLKKQRDVIEVLFNRQDTDNRSSHKTSWLTWTPPLKR